ncbi:MAG: hypothetical protein ACSHWZ_05610 [Sulfitobacter sp.]
MIFQLGLGALLVMGDLKDGFRLPGTATKAPHLTQPVHPGDQTRRFNPKHAPPEGRPFPSSALPERLVLTATQDGALLEGAIAEGDAERIIKQLDDLTPTPARIVLNSPGGSVRDALLLGRDLRARALPTALRSGDICYSACPYLLAGGTAREVPKDASVGVHQHYFGESSLLPAFLAVETIQRGQAEVMRYLDEMGIDLMIMQHALSTPPDEIYVLLPEELARYRFTAPAPTE